MDRRRSARAAIRLAHTYRAAEPSVVGDRLRDARTLAGRTQVEVAGGDVTAAYVSRVETGQRKPDFHLLARMAERAGTTIEMLLAPTDKPATAELRTALDHAELSLLSGDSTVALEKVERVLNRGDDLVESQLETRAKRIRALTLETLGDVAEAILALEEVATDSSSAGSERLSCLIALSRCYCTAGDIDHAAAAGEKARAALTELGLDGAPESIRVSVALAEAYSRRGDAEEANRHYQLATQAIARHASPTERAALYWRASLIEAERGAHQAAHHFARKALAYREVEADLRDLAHLRTNVAVAQLQRVPPDPLGAIDTLETAKLEATWSAVRDIDNATQVLARAQAHFLLGQEDHALEALAVYEHIAPLEAAALHAAGCALAAQIAIARGNPGIARQRTTQAIEHLDKVGADDAASAQLWVDIAGVLESLGDTAAALTAFRRAADSTGLRTPANPANPA